MNVLNSGGQWKTGNQCDLIWKASGRSQDTREFTYNDCLEIEKKQQYILIGPNSGMFFLTKHSWEKKCKGGESWSI